MLKNPTNLLNLQNLIKRDPVSYAPEFEQQWRHFHSQIHTLHTANTLTATDQQSHQHNAKQKEFLSLVSFLAHTAPCYPQLAESLPQTLMGLVEQSEHATALSSHARLTLVQSLILLQNRGLVSRFTLLPLLFALFALPDKRLRSLLFNHLLSDIKRVNAKTKSVKLNAALQNFIFNTIQRTDTHASTGAGNDASTKAQSLDASVGAKKSLELLVELWRRRIWIDDRTVNVIATACFSPHIKLTVLALRFFLGINAKHEVKGNNNENDSDSDVEASKKNDMRKSVTTKTSLLKGVMKRTKKREREIKRAVRKVNKERLSRDDAEVQFAPFDLIHDPQSFVERLFARVRSASCSFPVRLLMMQVIARCIAHHDLLLLNYYSFLQRYMQPHQRHVTLILTFLAQASHRLVPPDVLRPCVLTLADQFVTDRSSSQVMQIGLNAIREVCARQPLVMTRALLLDLAQYKKHKVKGVMMAARSIIQLFREKAPTLLKRRERGKEASQKIAANGGYRHDDAEVHDELFAVEDTATDIAGADLLMEQLAANSDDENEDQWADHDRGNDDDEEDEEFEDDDDDGPAPTLADVDAFLQEMESGERAEKAELDEELDQELYDGEGDEEVDEDESQTGDELELDDENEDADDGEQPEEEVGDADGTESKADDDSSEPAAKRVKTLPYAATRIFTPKDFAMLRELRLKALQAAKTGSLGRGNRIKALNKEPSAKEKDRLLSNADASATSIVEVDSIKGYQPHVRVSKADRLASVMEGRDEGANKGKPKPKGGGSTNAAKLRSKPFMLVKHSQTVRMKAGTSFADQQERAVTHIKNLRKAGNAKVAKKAMKRKRGY